MFQTKKRYLYVLGLFLAAWIPVSAWAGAVVTYHGRILDSANRPVDSQNVTFRIRIFSPNPGKCLLYEESRTISMLGSDGIFVIPIGDGVGYRTSADPGIVMEKIFTNDPNYTFNTTNTPKLICNSGTSYTADPLHQRQLFIAFDDHSGAGEQVLPMIDVNFIPFAVSSYDSQNIGGTPAKSVLRVSGGATAAPLSPAYFAELVALAAGTSTKYEKLGKINGITVPSLSNGQVLGWSGGSWAAITPMTSYTETDPTVRSFAKTNLPACAADQFLQNDGSGALVCVTVTSGGSGSVTSVSAGTGLLTDQAGNAAITGTGSLSVDVGTGANKIVQMTNDGKLPIVDGSNLTHVVASGLSSAATINTSGNITTSGTLTAGNFANTNLYTDNIYVRSPAAGGNSIRITGPTTPIASSYVLRLPESLPSTGTTRVLASDDSGNMTWLPQSAGGVASVSGTGAISVANGATSPVVSIATADTSTTGALSAADWNTFNNKQAAGNFVTTLIGEVTSSGYSSGTVTTTIANNAVTSGKIANGAVNSLSKVVASPGSAGPNRLLATDTGTGTTIQDFYCSTIGHVLKWTGTTGFGCAALTSSEISGFNTDVDARIAAQKGVANGLATLNASTRVPTAQLGSGTADATTYLRGDGSWSAISSADNTKLPLLGGTMAGDIDLDGHKLLNPSNVPFTAANPTVSQDGQSLRWDNTAREWKWFTAGVQGAGIGTLNGQVGTTQSFAPASSASSYGFSSASNVHTLSIPSAATGGVTAGTISKTEYDSFNSKLGTASVFAGDISGTSSAISVDKIKSKAVTLTSPAAHDLLMYDGTGFVNKNIPTCSAGYYLTFDGTNYSCSEDTIGSAPGDASYAAKGVVRFLTDADTSGITVNTGVANVNTGTGAHQIVKLDGSAKLPAVDGSALTNLNATNIATGALSSSVLPVVPVTKGGTGATTATAALNNLLPSQGSQAGKVLQTDGTNAAWVAGNAGTVTSVSGTGPISVATGTVTPVISIATANTTTTGALSSADWNTFNSKLGAASAFVGDVSGTASATSVDKIKGTPVTVTSLTDGDYLKYNGTEWVNSVISIDASAITSGTIAAARLPASASYWSAATGGINYGGGRVGIGTATPSSVLDIRAADPKVLVTATTGTNRAAMEFINNNGAGDTIIGTESSTAGYSLTGSAAYSTIFGSRTFSPLHLATNNATRLTISGSGDVGIGTTAPTSKLDVVGDINVTGSFKVNGTSISMNTLNDGLVFVGNSSNIAEGRTLKISDIKSTASGNWFTASGLCPSGQHLEYTSATDTVSCQAYSVTSFQVISALGYTPANGTNYVAKSGDSMSGTLNLPGNGLVVGGSQLVASGSKVGIGTATPLADLDVAGATKTIANSSGVLNLSAGPFLATNQSAPGTIRMTSGASHYPGGDVLLTGGSASNFYGAYVGAQVEVKGFNYTGASNINLKMGRSINASADGTNSLNVFDGYGNKRMTVLDTGNVGIGIAAPALPLDVSGTMGPPATTGTAQKGNLRLGTSNHVLDFGTTSAPPWGAWLQVTDKANLASNFNLLLNPNGGNVGVGTSSPSTALQVVGTKGLRLDDSTASKYGFISSVGNLHFSQNADWTPTDTWRTIQAGKAGGFQTNVASGEIFRAFGVDTSYAAAGDAVDVTARFVIKTNGNVGIGTISPTYLLQLATDSAAKPGTSTWTVASDERLKDIRAPFTRGLAALDGLNTVYFNYKKDNPLDLPSEKEYVGIRAQDALKVIPEAVAQDEKGYYHVTNDSIIWTAVNAIKELYHKVLKIEFQQKEQTRQIASKADKEETELLRAENARLKQENEAIKSRLDKIEKALLGK